MTALPIEISNFFLAMQAGKIGAAALESYFAPDAVYQEPFTGTLRRHEGRDDIIAAMAPGWEMPMIDTRIEVTDVQTEPGKIWVSWTCHSPSLPDGRGCGRNQFVLADGLIQSLITTLEV